eukprot:c22614_g1_i2 orf=301-2181(+)
MGSSFQHVVGHATGSFPLKRQRLLVDNAVRDAALNWSFQSNNGATLLRRKNPSCPQLSARPLQRNLQRRVKFRCCDAGAAEAEILVSDDRNAAQSSRRIPFDRTEFEVVQSFRDGENALLESVVHPKLSKPYATSETVFADEKSSSRGHEITTIVVNGTTQQRPIREEIPQLIDGDEGKGILQQMWDIVTFAGPALGIWLSGPMMSLISTAVVGNNNSLELAALGPGTVFCDQLSYVFMFLSVATSNLIATSLAKQDEASAAQHLSRLLFVALACGVGMFLLTGAFAEPLLKNFAGPQNVGIVSAAFSYVKIRGFAWPAVLVNMVAQSASLGMKDSWGPLKVLAVSFFMNLFGDILFCTYLGQGIAGAAWTTMVSQYVACFLMLRSLKKKGYSLALSIPSAKELLHMVEIAAPVLLTMLSKVSFYALITYLCTSLGAVTVGAHQVMVGIFSTFTVTGEPLCQTAQSFMPGLIQGASPNWKKAQMMLRSLLLIGGILGVSLGCLALGFPWVFPQVFTSDAAVISQMRAITIPFFCAIVTTPPLLSLEGTLLAGRDLKFLSLSMVSCFIGGAAMLLATRRLGFGLEGFWWTLTCFQSARFTSSFWRLKSAKSVLRDPEAKKSLQVESA